MRRRYRAQIWRRGKGYTLGRWPTERDAVIARDRAALHFDGEGAVLALPNVTRRLGPASPEELRSAARATWKETRGTSRYRGVTRGSAPDTWLAFLTMDGHSRNIGSFASERAAAIAHDEVALFVCGGAAALNFPRRPTMPRSLEDVRQALAAAKKRTHKVPYRGVSKRFDRPNGRAHQAHLRYGGRDLSLGNWKMARDAALAHDRAELFYRPERPWLHFPDLARSLGPASAEELRNESRREFKAQTWSRFRGVCYNRKQGTWNARVRTGPHYLHLGHFDSEEEAARAYDNAARRFHRPKATFNFDPVTGEELLWKEISAARTRKRSVR